MEQAEIKDALKNFTSKHLLIVASPRIEPGSGASSPQYCGDYTIHCFTEQKKCFEEIIFKALWPRQESNLDLELRKLLYYPLYYEAWVHAKTLSEQRGKEDLSGFAYFASSRPLSLGERVREILPRPAKITEQTYSSFIFANNRSVSSFLHNSVP